MSKSGSLQFYSPVYPLILLAAGRMLSSHNSVNNDRSVPEQISSGSYSATFNLKGLNEAEVCDRL